MSLALATVLAALIVAIPSTIAAVMGVGTRRHLGKRNGQSIETRLHGLDETLRELAMEQAALARIMGAHSRDDYKEFRRLRRRISDLYATVQLSTGGTVVRWDHTDEEDP